MACAAAVICSYIERETPCIQGPYHSNGDTKVSPKAIYFESIWNPARRQVKQGTAGCGTPAIRADTERSYHQSDPLLGRLRTGNRKQESRNGMRPIVEVIYVSDVVVIKI
jgi:hypothetical protein